jgi:hypothetical protein
MYRHCTARWIGLCVLGLLLGLGMGLSAVQAGSMTVKMALAGDIDGSGSGHGGCADCGGSDGPKSGNCVSICAAPVFSVLAPTPGFSPSASFITFADHTEPLVNTASSPDPHPPKQAILL